MSFNFFNGVSLLWTAVVSGTVLVPVQVLLKRSSSHAVILAQTTKPLLPNNKKHATHNFFANVTTDTDTSDISKEFYNEPIAN